METPVRPKSRQFCRCREYPIAPCKLTGFGMPGTSALRCFPFVLNNELQPRTTGKGPAEFLLVLGKSGAQSPASCGDKTYGGRLVWQIYKT